MTVVNVHTGQPLMTLAFEGQLREVEFIEQFNQHILIKSKNRPLRIQDLISGKKLYVPEFNSPDAFIFIYERDLFVNLRNGRIEVFNIDGELVTNFQNQELYTLSKIGETFEQRKQRKRGGNMRQDEIERALSSERNYIISLSQSRCYLFTMVRKDDIINERLS